MSLGFLQTHCSVCKTDFALEAFWRGKVFQVREAGLRRCNGGCGRLCCSDCELQPCEECWDNEDAPFFVCKDCDVRVDIDGVTFCDDCIFEEGDLSEQRRIGVSADLQELVCVDMSVSAGSEQRLQCDFLSKFKALVKRLVQDGAKQHLDILRFCYCEELKTKFNTSFDALVSDSMAPT